MKNEQRKTKSWGRSILGAAGMILIILVILLCSLLILPKLFGSHMYHVLSGSMEPELPVGSLICVREGKPEEVKEGDIIAFYSSLEGEGIITHRVVKNNVVSGNFRTRGDANEKEDPLPVSYDNYIGRMVLTVPYMGKLFTVMTSTYGKAAAVFAVLLGALMNLAASSGTGKRGRSEDEIQ